MSGTDYRRARVEAGLPARSDRERQRRKERLAERKAENLAMIQAYKLAHGCVDCGYSAHAEALEFDHLPGSNKKMAVTQMMGWSPNTVMAEIDKCEVVCANCHAVRTAQRRKTPPPLPE